MNITLADQEIVAWTGNAIFFIAQVLQIIHTFKKKHTKDISYGLQILWLIGNTMYTVFGYLDDSLAMFVGNLITCATALIQLCQKIFYDNYYKKDDYDEALLNVTL